MTKPPFPLNDPFAPWPRIPVDQTPGGDFDRMRQAAAFAADGLMLSDAGPDHNAPRAQQFAAAVEEALLYLLEMGVIDIDKPRLDVFLNEPHPPYREGR